MSKITYADKVPLYENTDIADINKVKADDMNEIKNVVNGLVKTKKTISDEETYACNYINDLMEFGSNDNGNYIKFYDGTMICYGDKYGTTALADYWGQFKRGEVPVTFPQEFVSTPLVNTGLKNAEDFAQLSVAADSITTSGFTARVFKPNNATNVGCNLTYIAIGKWK